MAKDAVKGTFLGRVTLDIWDNALPDVDFQPEKEIMEFFTWRHITIMKTGITRAMKSYIVEELRLEKERERMGEKGPLPEPTPTPAEIEPFVEKVVPEEIIPEAVVEEVELSSLELRNKRRVKEAEKIKEEERQRKSDLMKDILRKPDKTVDGEVDPSIKKIKEAKGHIPEGLDDIDPSAMRTAAHKTLKKHEGGQAEVYAEPVINDKDKVELGIDLPSQPQKVSKYANSPA